MFDEDFASKFWSKVDKGVHSDSCWEWTGCLIPKGYAQIWYKGKRYLVHRVSWQLLNGAIPDGLFVCHKCDNRRCVRPDHLFLGTNSDNIHDSYQKGRLKPPIGKRFTRDNNLDSHPAKREPHMEIKVGYAPSWSDYRYTIRLARNGIIHAHIRTRHYKTAQTVRQTIKRLIAEGHTIDAIELAKIVD